MNPSPPPLPGSHTPGHLAPFSTLLASQRVCQGIALLGLGLCGWLLAGNKLWSCWFFEITQKPCFTCGMTRGARRSLSGEFSTVWQAHAFAPLVLLAFGAIVLFGVLPVSWHQRAIRRFRELESTSRVTWILFGAFLLYGMLRLTGVIAFEP